MERFEYAGLLTAAEEGGFIVRCRALPPLMAAALSKIAVILAYNNQHWCIGTIAMPLQAILPRFALLLDQHLYLFVTGVFPGFKLQKSSL